MIMDFTEEEAKYINFKDWTCVKASTPPEILKSLMKADEYHFKMVGDHIIHFI